MVNLDLCTVQDDKDCSSGNGNEYDPIDASADTWPTYVSRTQISCGGQEIWVRDNIRRHVWDMGNFIQESEKE